MKHLIFILFVFSFTSQAQTLDSMFSNSQTLTDEQSKEAEKFNHTGRSQTVFNEKCKDNKELSECDPNKAASSGVIFKGDFGGNVEQHIGKLYAVLFGGLDILKGGGPTVTTTTDKDGKAAKVELTKEERKTLKTSGSVETKKDDVVTGKAEQKSDYCMYAAIGYEAAATVLQTVLQKKATTDASLAQDTQTQALIALEQTHKARRTTSAIQASVYTATAACYIARATGAVDKGKVVLDWKYWAKMSAASGLASLYWVKYSKHNKAVHAVREVIKSMPKTGDCNPWTDTLCFCNEKTSKDLYPAQYQEVCLLNGGNNDTPKIALGCVTTDANKQATYDKECNCKKTNSCIKATVTGYNPKFAFGSTMMNQANKGFEMLSSGNFDQGQFDQYSMQSGVMAAKIKSAMTSNMPAAKLNDDQNKVAGELSAVVPASVAALAATATPYSPTGASMDDGTSSALSNLSADLKKKVDEVEKSVKYSSKGSGFGSTAEAPEEGFQIPNFGAPEPQQAGTEVLSFAEQAVNKADVNNTPDTPIFDIISNRYRRSGWNKLNPEEEKK